MPAIDSGLDVRRDFKQIMDGDARSKAMDLTMEVSEFSSRRFPVAVIIPIWNQGNVILDQLSRMQDAKLQVDVLLCDGNSSDGSTSKSQLIELGVRTLLVTDRMGLGNALRMGFCYALNEGYKGVISLDGNGKDGVDAIASFNECLSNGYDFVQGSRFMSGGTHTNTPWERSLGIRLLIAPLISFASGHRYTDPTNGFKGMSRRFLADKRVQPLRPVFQQFDLQFYLNYIAPRLGFKVTEIPVSRVYPRGPIPTKIIGIRTKLSLLRQFFAVILGRYNVPIDSAHRGYQRESS